MGNIVGTFPSLVVTSSFPVPRLCGSVEFRILSGRERSMKFPTLFRVGLPIPFWKWFPWWMYGWIYGPQIDLWWANFRGWFHCKVHGHSLGEGADISTGGFSVQCLTCYWVFWGPMRGSFRAVRVR